MDRMQKMFKFYENHNLNRHRFSKLVGCSDSPLIQYENNHSICTRYKIRIYVAMRVIEEHDIIFKDQSDVDLFNKYFRKELWAAYA